MIQVVHPGSGLFTHPGSRGQKGTGSRFRNTGESEANILGQYGSGFRDLTTKKNSYIFLIQNRSQGHHA
jgi:hypothetical protein